VQEGTARATGCPFLPQKRIIIVKTLKSYDKASKTHNILKTLDSNEVSTSRPCSRSFSAPLAPLMRNYVCFWKLKVRHVTEARPDCMGLKEHFLLCTSKSLDPLHCSGNKDRKKRSVRFGMIHRPNLMSALIKSSFSIIFITVKYCT
jgi:hypothetical protein